MAQKYDSRTMNRGDASWRETKARQASAKKWAEEINKINAEKNAKLKPIESVSSTANKSKLVSIKDVNPKVDKNKLTSIKTKTPTTKSSGSAMKKTATPRTNSVAKGAVTGATASGMAKNKTMTPIAKSSSSSMKMTRTLKPIENKKKK